MGWYYRARRKRCPVTKEWVYDVVEYFPDCQMPIGEPYKVVKKESKMGLGSYSVASYKEYKNESLWTTEGIKPMGLSKKELIRELRAMLLDVIKYKTFTDKDSRKKKPNG